MEYNSTTVLQIGIGTRWPYSKDAFRTIVLKSSSLILQILRINLTGTLENLSMPSYANAIKLQEKLALKVSTKDSTRKLERICAVDVSYKGQDATAAAVIMDGKTLQILERVTSRTKVKTPYIPGLMMLRESGPILSTLNLLKENYDVLLVDGNGQLHPRKFGLACYIGIVLDKPTIGIAKSLLCGTVIGNSVKLGDEILAHIIEKKKGKKIFVSIGNKISLKTAAKLTESLIKEGEWMPEPLRLADQYSKTIPK